MLEVILSEHAHLRLRQRYPQFRAVSRHDIEQKFRASLSRNYVTLASTPGNRRVVSFLVGAHTVYASVWMGLTEAGREVMTVITVLTAEMAAETGHRYAAMRSQIQYSNDRIKKSRRYRRKRRGWDNEE